MTPTPFHLNNPRFESHPAILIAGIADRYTPATKAAIPSLWMRFVPYLGKISGQLGSSTYGVCLNFGDNGAFDYLCAVQVDNASQLPPEFVSVQLPTRSYAVFAHTDHISRIALTWQAIFGDWLPSSGCTLERELQFELYTDAFDPRTGTGLVEIWIPLKAGPEA